MDATRTTAALTHRAGADDQPSSTCATPPGASGRTGSPRSAGARRIWEDVPDEKWNDWRWQLSNRVNDAGARSSRILNLTDDEREGLSAPDKFRVDITPYFVSLIDPDDPNDPIRAPGHPRPAGSCAPSPG